MRVCLFARAKCVHARQYVCGGMRTSGTYSCSTSRFSGEGARKLSVEISVGLYSDAPPHSGTTTCEITASHPPCPFSSTFTHMLVHVHTQNTLSRSRRVSLDLSALSFCILQIFLSFCILQIYLIVGPNTRARRTTISDAPALQRLLDGVGTFLTRNPPFRMLRVLVS